GVPDGERRQVPRVQGPAQPPRGIAAGRQAPLPGRLSQGGPQGGQGRRTGAASRVRRLRPADHGRDLRLLPDGRTRQAQGGGQVGQVRTRVKARKVAALYDVHGNLPALEAVLAEVEREQPDVIVFGGDLAAGWYPVEVLDRVRALPNARFVSGNCEREMLGVFDSGGGGRHEMTTHAAHQLSRADRDFIAAFEPTVEVEIEGLGPVLFCHAT